uniref:hypothetical protein n=1 Tax=Pseudomonas lundensis TaxID=86185 RepID=UPI0028D3E877
RPCQGRGREFESRFPLQILFFGATQFQKTHKSSLRAAFFVPAIFRPCSIRAALHNHSRASTTAKYVFLPLSVTARWTV